jgi:rare lipoprotein A
LGFTNRGVAWVRVQYVGRAPIEGSNDEVLASTLRDNGPAPAPGDVRMAATQLIPHFPAQPPPVRHQQLASLTDALDDPEPARTMSYASGPDGAAGTDQFLNGRGLY